MNIIHVDRLTKDFDAVRAVDDLSFGIREGTIAPRSTRALLHCP